MFQSSLLVDAMLNISLLLLGASFTAYSVSYLFEAVGQCIVMSLSSSSNEKLLDLSTMEYRNNWSGNFTQEQKQMASALSRFAVLFL